ncbi:MAG: hypothetical protein V3S69_07430 [Dehalococcoidales bacterium]
MNAEALHTYLGEQSLLPQKLGVIDCVTFVTGAVKAGWDRDFYFTLKYGNRRSAVARLRELGGLSAAVDGALGSRYPISELPEGSVVYLDVPSPTLGLVLGDQVLVKVHKQVIRVTRDSVLYGWRTT